MPGSMSIGGVVSGLKTDDIISKIMEYARRPQNLLQADKAAAQSKLAAWQDLNTRVLALKTKCDSIAVTGGFQVKRATSTDMDVMTAVASVDAAAGTYYLKVSSRAQGHQLSSQSFSSMDTDIGTGTVSIAFPQASENNFNVTIDSANNTLAGLRDSINRADEGVQASIINAGSSDDPDYRLLLTSTTSGEAAEFTVNTTGLVGGTQAPSFTQIVQQATDATITFGEGAGAITVTKSTNTITDLIPGVTLTIGTPDDSQFVKVEVAQDSGAAKSAIQSFVTQYNDLMDAIDAQFDYDSETGESGALLGSYELQAVQMNLASMISTPVTGVTSNYSVLSSVGITLNTSGHLVIDETELDEALEENLNDVTKLFASKMESDSTYISYVSSSSSTQPSGTNGWNVVVTQAASRSQVTGAVAMDNVTGLTANETLTINTHAIALTASMKVSDVVNEINKYSSETGVSALATGADGTGTGNYLTLRTTRYGSSFDLHAYSSLSNQGTNTSGIGGTLVSGADPDGETGTGVGSVGLNVEGTINGEHATGSGQILTAHPEDDDSPIEGLMLTITASGPITSKVYLTKGIGVNMRDLLLDMTSSTGAITTVEDSLDSEIDTITDDIAEMETRLTAQQDRLYAQFNAMESRLAELQQQGNYLTSQLSSLSSSKSK